MSSHHTHAADRTTIYLIVLAAVSGVLFVALGYALFQLYQLGGRTTALSQQLASTTSALEGVSGELASLTSQTTDLSHTLATTKEDVAAATSNLSAVQNQVGGVEQTMGSITGQVSTLQKLATTDPELLKKYSKVYFLNENYTPAHLSAIPQDEVYSNTKQEQFLSEAEPYLNSMLTAAKSAGVTLYVVSAYRSFGTQAALKSEYEMTYGEGANTFSADQGYSEHQLGTTVDLITTGLGGQLTDAFGDTSTYAWLQNNAYKFGFELSYPKGNDYYVYEPWHWRFVGVKLATYLHDNHLNFYDVDQRTIDTYLADLFD